MPITCPCCQLSKPFQPPSGAARELPTRCPRCGVAFAIQSATGECTRIECPKCLKKQPSGEVCCFCGVVFRKFVANRQIVAEGRAPAARPEATGKKPVTSVAASGGSKRMRWLGAAVALVLLVAGAGLFYLWQGRKQAEVVAEKASPIFTSLATGEEHTVVSRSDGTVWSWGHNAYGQLGTGDAGGEQRQPKPVIGLAKVVAVAAGYTFTLALKEDGSVWSWGDNRSGQLGIGIDTEFRRSPTQVVNLSDVTAIDAGRGYALALTAGGQVWVWGENDFGQLGDYGFARSSNAPMLIKNLEGIVAIAAGELHGLALDSKGSVYAWGGNYYGEIGDGGFENRSSPYQIGNLPPIKAIAAGDGISLAMAGDGSIWQWGMVHAPPRIETENLGKFGWRKPSCEPLPVPVAGINEVVAISAGRGKMLALTKGGGLWSWKTFKEYDDPNPEPFIPKVVIAATASGDYSDFGPIVSFTAGNRHNLAVHADGTLWAWGWDYFGQLGIGDSKRGYTPTPVSVATGLMTLGNVPTEIERPALVVADTTKLAIASGHEFALFLRADNSLWSWGKNDQDQLGRGVISNRSESSLPGEVKASFSEPVVTVAAGPTQAFALTASGTVWSWGKRVDAPLQERSEDRFGNPLPVQNTTPRPTPLTRLEQIRSLSSGMEHYLALRNDGRVFVWGYNRSGELGTGGIADTFAEPELVPKLEGIQAVSAGGRHSLALDEQGRVWAWGNNQSGQLGNGGKINRYTPRLVPDLSEVVAIEAGNAVSLALKRDGTVWSWGAGIGSGDGTQSGSTSPTMVRGLTEVTAIGCGGKLLANAGFVLALRRDGSVWAWGNNIYGQLGTGKAGGETSRPAIVPGLDNVAKIASGGTFSLVLRRDGSLWGWGSNMGGQLGEAVVTSAPVQVWAPVENVAAP